MNNINVRLLETVKLQELREERRSLCLSWRLWSRSDRERTPRDSYFALVTQFSFVTAAAWGQSSWGMSFFLSCGRHGFDPFCPPD